MLLSHSILRHKDSTGKAITDINKKLMSKESNEKAPLINKQNDGSKNKGTASFTPFRNQDFKPIEYDQTEKDSTENIEKK